jgi:hypothetical protein
MNCRTWDRLYEEYEKATLQRLARSKDQFGLRKPADRLEKLNANIVQALRELHQHELTHRCHG